MFCKGQGRNEIIEKLVDIVSKGGNYLLNIGPGPDGEFDPVAYERLKKIGAWMKVNGEAIYGTRMHAAFKDGDNIRFTQSKDGKTKYIFLFDFPTEKLILTKIDFAKNAHLEVLGSKSKVTWTKASHGVELELPASAKIGSEHVWVVRMKQK